MDNLMEMEQTGIEVKEGESTLQLKQCNIVKLVDLASAMKSFHLELDKFGPYKIKYTLNGRHLLLGGRKGHVASFDWTTKGLHTEMNVMESVHDIAWLHNENMFAVAQKNWTYIYDNQGIEIHCLKKLDRVESLDFLPYHFLLVAGHQSGFLSWVDVSIGKIVTQYGARHGPLNIMTSNPGNAVTCCGHSNGTVSFWTPSVKTSVASVLCHGCSVSAVAFDSVGRLMATGGVDNSIRIWDLRNSFKPLTSFKAGIVSQLAFSQTGLLSIATSNQVLILSEVGKNQKPYLKHVCSTPVSSIQFCPFEDILGVGTKRGIDSIIVPGAGEQNFDALERNPYQVKKQRREAEVKALLEKIPADLIALDNSLLSKVNQGKNKDLSSSSEKDDRKRKKPSFNKKVTK